VTAHLAVRALLISAAVVLTAALPAAAADGDKDGLLHG
jgi:hypothetical protein